MVGREHDDVALSCALFGTQVPTLTKMKDLFN